MLKKLLRKIQRKFFTKLKLNKKLYFSRTKWFHLPTKTKA